MYGWGGAIIWTIIYHSKIKSSLSIFSLFKSLGYGAVDIFIFSSGLGNYFSYDKVRNPLVFLKKKIKRLFITWLPFIIFWLIINIYLKRITYIQIVGNLLLCIQGLSNSGGEFNWYLAGLLIMYVLTPYFFEIIDNNLDKNNIKILLLLVLCSSVFWNDGKLIIMASRIPLYYIGMLYAKKNEDVYNTEKFFNELVCFIIGCILIYIFFTKFDDYLWNYGLYWYPFILITPFICNLLSIICISLCKYPFIKTIINIVDTIGRYSFELYLSHILIFELTQLFITKDLSTLLINTIYIIAILFSFLFALLIRKTSKLLTIKLEKIKY